MEIEQRIDGGPTKGSRAQGCLKRGRTHVKIISHLNINCGRDKTCDKHFGFYVLCVTPTGVGDSERFFFVGGHKHAS